jgi:putative transposase
MLPYYCVLVCKYRHKLLKLVDIDKIIQKTFEKSDLKLLEYGHDDDHIHILVQSKPKYSPSNIVRYLKQTTTKEIWNNYNLSDYLWKTKNFWNNSYFICTVGDVNINKIRNYIRNQS